MQDKIIAAIAAYLGKVMTYNSSLTKIQFERTCVNGAAEFIKQEAEQIASAIAPLVDAGEVDWRDVVKIQNESTYTFELVISGVVVGYASKAGLQSKYTFHPAQYLALSAAHLDAISAVIKHYNK